MTEENREAAEYLWMDLAKEIAHPDAECTEEEVEEQAACCQETMGRVLDATTKKMTICARSQIWWNTNIKARWKVVCREKIRRWNADGAIMANAELWLSFPQSNSKMWNE